MAIGLVYCTLWIALFYACLSPLQLREFSEQAFLSKIRRVYILID